MKKPVETKKLPKGVSQEFMDSLNTMSTDQLKAQIVILQVQNQENEDFKQSTEYIQAQSEFEVAKDKFDLVAGPVKETSISLKNQTRAVIERLKEKGGA